MEALSRRAIVRDGFERDRECHHFVGFEKECHHVEGDGSNCEPEPIRHERGRAHFNGSQVMGGGASGAGNSAAGSDAAGSGSANGAEGGGRARDDFPLPKGELAGLDRLFSGALARVKPAEPVDMEPAELAEEDWIAEKQDVPARSVWDNLLDPPTKVRTAAVARGEGAEERGSWPARQEVDADRERGNVHQDLYDGAGDWVDDWGSPRGFDSYDGGAASTSWGAVALKEYPPMPADPRSYEEQVEASKGKKHPDPHGALLAMPTFEDQLFVHQGTYSPIAPHATSASRLREPPPRRPLPHQTPKHQNMRAPPGEHARAK